MSTEVFNYGLLVFASFFTLLNPGGTLPVFMTMTASLSEADRRGTARKAVIAATLTLAFFSLTGNVLFDFFGISVDGFRIVGGIIFFLMGQDMLQARLVSTKISKEEVREYVTDISITPLAIPMLSGPGSITNAIVLVQDAPTTLHLAAFAIGLGLVMVLAYVIFAAGGTIMRLLGEVGNKVLMRLMGLIVMVIAVELFFSGLIPMLQKAFPG